MRRVRSSLPVTRSSVCGPAGSPDHPLVTIENPATFAGEAGFDGERVVDTWRRRMKQLQALNFIAPERGPSGDFHYVLLLNPNVAVEHMRTRGMVQDGLYGIFLDRLVEVGGFGEIEAVRALWQQQTAQATAAAAAAAPPATNSAAEATLGTAALSAGQAAAVPLPPGQPANVGGT